MTRTLVLLLSLAVVLAAGVVHATLNPPLTDEQLADAMARLSTTVEGKGDEQTFSFITSHFGVPTTTLLQEQAQFGQTSSEIFMAHTFAEVSRTTTATQILTLREQGLSWTQISNQLRFGMPQLREVFETAIARFKVQAGLAPGTTTGGTTTGATTTTSVTTTGGTTTGGTTASTGGTTTSGTASGTTTDGSTTAPSTTAGTTTRTSGETTQHATTSGTTSFKGAPGVDRKVTTLATRLETSAESRGDQATAERLANQFDVTTSVLLQQRTEFDADWGDLFLAYTVMDQSRRDVTLDDIFALRDQGLSWTQIAWQYRIPPGRLLQAVRSGTATLTTLRSGIGKTRMAGHGGATKSTQGTTMRSGAAGALALKVRGSGSTRMGGSAATKVGGARATKMGGASATRMGGASATKMGGMSATKMGGISATKMGGMSATRMGGASVTRMGGASATRMGGSATRVHGNGH
jgi:hypothetical protein